MEHLRRQTSRGLFGDPETRQITKQPRTTRDVRCRAYGAPHKLRELGLIDEFLKLPHKKVETLTGQVGAEHLKMVGPR